MAIKRRSVLAGGAALWVSAPAILRAQGSSKVRIAGTAAYVSKHTDTENGKNR